MTIPVQPLSLIMEIAQSAGFDIGHAYDDLVFITHNVFIFRFTQTGEQVDLIFNKDCEMQAELELTEKLTQAAKPRGIQLTRKGYYTLSQLEDENMALEFFESAVE